MQFLSTSLFVPFFLLLITYELVLCSFDWDVAEVQACHSLRLHFIFAGFLGSSITRKLEP
ncbi:hypothetical protein GLYMA_09G208650v4 [Glycine max]|nr:hypothetical protein GLYMA_09G208650v4 [Glycine max]